MWRVSGYMKRLMRSGAVPRVRRWLPLSAIKIDRYPFSRVLPIVDFMRNGGETRPIHVEKRHMGYVVKGTWPLVRHYARFEWVILDGRHRYMAHRLLQRPLIEVIYGQREEKSPGTPLALE